jgi:hypothetical protein
MPVKFNKKRCMLKSKAHTHKASNLERQCGSTPAQARIVLRRSAQKAPRTVHTATRSSGLQQMTAK